MQWTDEEIDRRMGRLLQVGVLTAAAVMLAGSIAYLVLTPEPEPDYSHFHSGAHAGYGLWQIVAGAFHGQAGALIQLGTLLMIATPVARVAFAAYAFGRVRDRMYVIVSCVVLALLTYSIFFGK